MFFKLELELAGPPRRLEPGLVGVLLGLVDDRLGRVGQRRRAVLVLGPGRRRHVGGAERRLGVAWLQGCNFKSSQSIT